MTAAPNKPSAYTHGINLQIGYIPAGFFPIGSIASLTQLVKNHQAAGGAQDTIELYKLQAEPDFVRPQIDETALGAMVERIVKGEKDVAIDTAAIRGQVLPIVAQFGGLFGSVRKNIEEIAEAKRVDPMKLASVFGVGQVIVDTVKATGEGLRAKAEAAFWPAKTEDYIRNEHGVFVSRTWLENPANAARETTIQLKKAAAGTAATL